MSSTQSVLRDPEGRIVGSTAFLRDVTEERQLQSDLQRAKELALVGEIATGLMHHLKNRLGGIYAALQLCRGSGDPCSRHGELLHSTLAELRALDSTVSDLIAYARPPAPRRVKTSLRPFLEALVHKLAAIPDFRRHEVDVVVRGEVSACVDPSILEEALAQLAINAAQSMCRPGRVLILASGCENMIEIEVVDEGDGIPESMKGAIFQPFVTTRPGGTGLGLPIARRQAMALGGDIRFESHAGRGSRFVMRIPAVDDEEPPACLGPPAEVET